MTNLRSWAGLTVTCPAIPLFWTDENPFEATEGTLLPYGNGRSYGDVCLPHQKAVLCRGLDRIRWFDKNEGIICVEAGVRLGDLACLLLHHKWMVPILPGTGHVTVGGAIGNDIHGKNHHWAGTFGCWVNRFELLRSDGRIICSPRENTELFAATIGGLGLTGIITWIELRLLQCTSTRLACMATRFESLDEYFELSIHQEQTAPYVVAWCDLTRRNRVRGIIYSASVLNEKSGLDSFGWKHCSSLPTTMPLINRVTNRIAHTLHYELHKRHTQFLSRWSDFFFPLDAIPWNQLFGRKGLLQIQAVLPAENARVELNEIIAMLQRVNLPLPLCVLKNFGSMRSPGILSFPMEGTSIAVDLPVSMQSLTLARKLADFIASIGGRLYPAKDSIMQPEHFQHMYPEWSKLEKLCDKRCCSQFWRRVTGQSNL